MTTALENIKDRLEELKKSGQLRGSLSPEAQFELITGSTDLEQTIKGAKFVQVCLLLYLNKVMYV